MFLKSHRMTTVLFGTALIMANARVAVPQGRPRDVAKRVVIGHVLASVDSLISGAGLGPKYETFIFGVESKGKKGKQIVTPVEIVYAYHKSTGPLPAVFFDYSKRYELRVERDSRCDEKLGVLSYEKNEDENGKELPATYILRMMDGAPKDLLKSDSLLPCYILRSGDYRVQK